jgi:acyl-CoA thioesterase FadM
VRLERVGTKSVTARAELRAPDGRMAAEAELVIVARSGDGHVAASERPERAAFEGARDE